MMMTTLLTTHFAPLSNSDAGAPAAKDSNEKTKDDFLHLLAGFCLAPQVMPAQASPSEPADVKSESPAIPAANPIAQAGSAALPLPTPEVITTSEVITTPPTPISTSETTSEQATATTLPVSNVPASQSAVADSIMRGFVPQAISSTPEQANVAPAPLLGPGDPTPIEPIKELTSIVSADGQPKARPLPPLMPKVSEQPAPVGQTPAKPTNPKPPLSANQFVRLDAETAGSTEVKEQTVTKLPPPDSTPILDRERVITPPIPAPGLTNAAQLPNPKVRDASPTSTGAMRSQPQLQLPPEPVSQSAGATDPLPLVTDNAAQTLQDQAAQRDAGLVAGYLAEAARDAREANPLLSIRKQFAAQSDSQASEDKHEPMVSLVEGLAQSATTDLSFASVANKLAVEETTPPVTVQAIEKILALAETLSVRQIRSIQLRLKPQELGQVDIQLKRDAEGKISAHLTAQHETARQVLSQSLGQLRQSLERAGLTVDRLHVRADAGSLKSNSNNESNRSQYRRSPSANAKSLAINPTEERGAAGVRADKLLSLSA